MQKAIFVDTISNDLRTNHLDHDLRDGWKVVSVTAQHVAVTGDYYNNIKGGFLVILEKVDEKH